MLPDEAKTELADEMTACLTELLVTAGLELAKRGIRAERVDSEVEEGGAQNVATVYLLVDSTAVYMASVELHHGQVAERSRRGLWLVSGLRMVGLTDLAEAVEDNRQRKAAS